MREPGGVAPRNKAAGASVGLLSLDAATGDDNFKSTEGSKLRVISAVHGLKPTVFGVALFASDGQQARERPEEALAGGLFQKFDNL